jgi:hypothetical protein
VPRSMRVWLSRTTMARAARETRASVWSSSSALPHHFAAQIPAIDPDAVVGAIAGLGVRLAGGLDKGPDATVPEEVHRRLEQRADEVRR